MKKLFLIASYCLIAFFAQAQNVGIGIINPLVRFHVADSTVIFSANQLTAIPSSFNLPVNGAGTRLMWMPVKSAFRVGSVNSTQWDADSIGLFSFASGRFTKALAESSTAMGFNTKASGIYSTAIGAGTTAAGFYSTAAGNNTSATGNSATTFGYNTTASGYYSTAFGSGSIANGDAGFAAGLGTNASAYVSTALGSNTEASNYASTAMGAFTSAPGYIATSMGQFTRATGSSSVAMGNNTNSKAYSSLSIGAFNDTVSSSNIASWVSADPLFYIGNGSSDASRHNAMVVYKNGNMVLKNPSLVFTDPPSFELPIAGSGTRMMWLPQKAAFRAGSAGSTSWNAANIGLGSFATGNNNTASGEYSTAIGISTIASGIYSFAMGSSSLASGGTSVALGVLSVASGPNSTAMGRSTEASGTYSTAMGSGTTANGGIAMAMGLGSTASGYTATSMGQGTLASGNHATSMGLETIAGAFASVALGRFNDNINTAATTAWVDTDPLLILGNGSSAVSRSNAMVVYKNGNTDLNGKSSINYLSNISNPHLSLIENNVSEFTHLGFYNRGGVNNLTDRWLMRAYPLGNNASRRINFYTNGGANSGDILTIYGNGNATLAGTLTQLSDARLKTNILPIDSAAEKLSGVHGYYYNWKETERDPNRQIGLLAQEVNKIFPELVQKDGSGNLAVNYSGLVPLLLNAVNEQQHELQQLKKQIEEMKTRQDEMLKFMSR